MEKLSNFLTFLVPKLLAPMEDELSKGILEAIDMDSCRVEKRAVQDIPLPDEDAEIGPVPTEGGGQKPEPEMDLLSDIVKDFNHRFGNIEWKDQDEINKVLSEGYRTRHSLVRPRPLACRGRIQDLEAAIRLGETLVPQNRVVGQQPLA